MWSPEVIGPDFLLTEPEFLSFCNGTFQKLRGFFQEAVRKNPSDGIEPSFHAQSKPITAAGKKAAQMIDWAMTIEDIDNTVILVLKVGVSGKHVQATDSGENSVALSLLRITLNGLPDMDACSVCWLVSKTMWRFHNYFPSKTCPK